MKGDYMSGDDAQHIIPIRNANRTTGAVYCPLALYEG